MDISTSKMLLAASGGGAADPVYVDDVFSTFLYDGTGAAQTITNGIDLAGEGGLTWIKKRTGSDNNELFDTERGAGRRIRTDSTSQQTVFGSSYLNAFNSNGFTLGNDGGVNASGHKYASWSFRKARGFFDVVTWAGDGNDYRQISHSLGSTPGMIWIKQINSSSPWTVVHRSLSSISGNYIYLNSTAAQANGSVLSGWDASSFTIGNYNVGNTNESGNYVAYIFAHDDASFGTDQDQSIIKCGTYSGNGSTTGTVVTLGFEPQFVLMKNTTRSSQWMMFDSMRGIASGGNDPYFHPSDTDAEYAAQDYIELTSTGFQLKDNATTVNQNGDNYIYMAIRRPNKPPEVATDVFAMDTGSSSSTIPTWDSGFPVDFALVNAPAAADNWWTLTRLTGDKLLQPNLTNAEVSGGANWVSDSMTGWGKNYNSGYLSWMFKRAPGFFDVVAFTGDGTSNRALPHNLEVSPELIIWKNRTGLNDWRVASSHIGFGDYDAIGLNLSDAKGTTGMPISAVSSTSLTLNYNNNTLPFLVFLFATLPGISKVGSYTGTGSALNIDCGFSYGARFVLIKRTDSTGNWLVYDTSRGIVSGNDPYIRLNSTQVQTTDEDHVDPLNAGFTVTTHGDVNTSGGTYLFLAIA